MNPTSDFLLSGCRVEPQRNRLSDDSSEVLLEPRVMDVLVSLSSRHPEVVSRDQLIDDAWEGRAVTDEVVNRSIFELRKAFRELGIESEVVETVRKRGYRLAMAPAVAPSFEITQKSQNWFKPGGLVLAVIVVFAILVWWFKTPVDSGLKIPDQESQVLEILPIEFDGQHSEQKVVGLALQEGVTDAISHQPALIVRKPEALTSGLTISNFEDSHARLRLELSERDQGGWAVNAAMSDANDQIIWQKSLSLDADLANLGRSQRELTSEVMSVLNAQLIPTKTCEWPADIQALELHFAARDLVNQRGEENIREAIDLFGEALERQPDFAQAWAGLGRANEILPVYIDGEAGIRERARTDPLAKAAYQQALNICPTHALAFQKAGPTPEYEGQNEWILSHYRMRKAFEIDSNDGEAVRHYANIMFRTGRLTEYRQLLEHAGRVDPYNPRILMELSSMAMNLGELELAENYLKKLRDQGSMMFYPMLEHRLAAEKQDWDLVNEIGEQLPPPMRDFMSKTMHYQAAPEEPGALDQLRRALREEMESGMGGGPTMVHILAVRMGQVDIAYEAWEQMRKDNYNLMTLWMPQGTAFRQDPRFFDVVNELGLVEYWLHTGDPEMCAVSNDQLICES